MLLFCFIIFVRVLYKIQTVSYVLYTCCVGFYAVSLMNIVYLLVNYCRFNKAGEQRLMAMLLLFYSTLGVDLWVLYFVIGQLLLSDNEGDKLSHIVLCVSLLSKVIAPLLLNADTNVVILNSVLKLNVIHILRNVIKVF